MKRPRSAEAIKVAVVGYGGAFNMGKQHLNEMQRAGMTPAAVCEIDPARLEVATTDFPGIATYSSVAKMLKQSDADLVTIITPHNTHAPIALQCLKAGKHVVCEKPMAITTAECDAMIAAAKASKVMLSTYHNRHWDGCILEALHWIRGEKAIGSVFRAQGAMAWYGAPGDWWRSNRKISGGILYDWGVHLLEYALQVFDAEIAEISGYAHTGHWAKTVKWGKDTNEDEACAVVRFKNGSWLTLTLSHLESRSGDGMLTFTGTEGAYVMDHKGYRIIQHRNGQTITTSGRNRDGEAHRYYENVAAHLMKGEKLVITGEWARRPIHILDCAVKSAQSGRAIAAKYA